MQVVEGNIRATGKKIAIVVARFNSFVVESLLEGALDTLDRHGEVNEDDITVVRGRGGEEVRQAKKDEREKSGSEAAREVRREQSRTKTGRVTEKEE